MKSVDERGSLFVQKMNRLIPHKYFLHLWKVKHLESRRSDQSILIGDNSQSKQLISIQNVNTNVRTLKYERQK